tara:strand:+ start:25143 stop:25562 length:420 start_codon:yes stop_codon:yes gene_type:complete
MISAILYRIPRGGGLGEGRSFIGALIWSVVTSVLAALWLGHWFPLLGWPFLLAGEAPGWSKWWPNQPSGGNILRLSLRGCLLLNPLMGPIYFWCYRHKTKLPKFGKIASGWTEWAELGSGFVTSAMFNLICYIFVRFWG